jgi:hypothetical protein
LHRRAAAVGERKSGPRQCAIAAPTFPLQPYSRRDVTTRRVGGCLRHALLPMRPVLRRLKENGYLNDYLEVIWQAMK